MKKINYKLTRGGLHYLAILPLLERREVFNLKDTSTSFNITIGDFYYG